jgi:hypothetical protein
LRERDIIESADRVRKLKQEIGGRSMSALSV